MKMHKFEVFVIDFDDLGVEACKQEVERSRDMSIRALSQDTADIGPWDDSHELNSFKTPVERFNSYFATQPQAPKGGCITDGDRYQHLRNMPEALPADGLDVAVWRSCSGESIRGKALDDRIDSEIKARAPTKTPEVLE
jgi:hypothetical protein